MDLALRKERRCVKGDKIMGSQGDKNKVADESLYRNKMRVYELAKEWNTYSKVIVMSKSGVGVKSNGSAV